MSEQLAELRAALKAGASPSAYDLALTLLSMLGLDSRAKAINAAPGMCPRTLSRIYAQGVPMCMSDLPSGPQEHGDSLEVAELAREAKVDQTQAMSALLRYGNPLARVREVLTDIAALVRHGCSVRNPTGLFVRLMRSGAPVRLPARAQATRAQAPDKATHPPLQPGEWVRWCGEWMQVMSLKGLQAFLSPSADLLDLYKINTDLLLHLPRRASFPAGNGGLVPG